jgi:hypothetical protein
MYKKITLVFFSCLFAINTTYSINETFFFENDIFTVVKKTLKNNSSTTFSSKVENEELSFFIQDSEFSSFIQKAAANEAIKDYFSATANEYVTLISRDETALNKFLKTTDSIFGKTLMKDDDQVTSYILVDFNVMYSESFIKVVLKEINNGTTLQENVININY